MRSRQVCIAALLLCAGSASAQSTWVNSAGGNWNVDSNWSTPTFPNAAGDSAILPGFGSPYNVLCNINPSIDSLNISSANAQLSIENANTLRILTGAGVVNDGTIVINDTASVFNAFFVFDAAAGAVSIGGTGHVELNGGGADPGDATLRAESGASLTLLQPVVGAGRIDAQGTVDNQSTIVADVPGFALEVTGTVTQTPSASMEGSTGLVLLKNATVTGGQFLGGVEATSSSTISNVVLTGANSIRDNSTMSVASPGIQNNGLLTVNSTASVFNASLESAGSVSIVGNGTIDLNGAGADHGDAVLRSTTGNPMTVGVNQTVSGNGRIDGSNEPMTFRGLALADRPGEDLEMTGTFDFDNLGRTQSAGGIVLLRNADVTSGLLQGSTDTSGTSTLITCANSGSLRIRENSVLLLEGSLINNGSILVNSTGSVFNSILKASVDTAISGTGTITLNVIGTDVNDAQLNADAGVTLDIGAGQTVDGAGHVNATGLMNMSGDYIANVAGLDLRIEGTHVLMAGATVQGTGGGTAVFHDADVTGGTFLGGVEVSGITTMRGFTNSGSLGLRENSRLTIDGSITNADQITINTTASVFNSRIVATAPITLDNAIILNGAGSAFDAQLEADESIAGSIDLLASSTVSGNGLLNGPMDVQGALTPGVDDLSPGTIQLQQDITLHPTTTVSLDFEDSTGSVLFDKLTGTSDIVLDGTIELRLQGGYEPAIGDRFTIISANSVTGNFATTTTPIIGTHLFRVIEQSNKVEALWTCLGDVNLDGSLDASDFSAWIAAYNSGDVEVGDQNLDGTLTPADFTAWIANFNAGC
ncbi:MAG TPA: hypothetical protein ENJ00_02850 [Phycisphaerales bacterium]|nr:hypothetical protein [Phycisphaerales bacterium]